MQFVLIGVDIGITTAIAAINLKGKVVDVTSRRDFSYSDIIKHISKIGTPLVIATDKKKVPGTIKKIAASFGCNAYTPRVDLSVDEKERLTWGKRKNDHERDALASVLTAFNSHSRQFRKIENLLIISDLNEKSETIKEMVVRKKAKNIAEAIEKLKPKEIEKEEPVRRESADWKKVARQTKNKLKRKENSYKILKKYTEKLEIRLKRLEEQRKQKIEEEIRKSEDARKSVIKEKEIKQRDIILKQMQFELVKHKQDVNKFKSMVEKNDEYDDIKLSGLTPVIIIANFSKEEIVEANKDFDLMEQVVFFERVNPSKQAARALISMQPKVILGRVDDSLIEMLENAGIPVIDAQVERKGFYGTIERKTLENLIKGHEKTSFLDWLKLYKRR